MDPSKYTNWRKSRRSGGGDNCVEVAFAADGTVGVRDSKDLTGPILEFTPAKWGAFVDAVGDGGLDAEPNARQTEARWPVRHRSPRGVAT